MPLSGINFSEDESMLSNKLKREDKIYSVCKKSGSITAGQTFKGIRLADEDGMENLRDSA